MWPVTASFQSLLYANTVQIDSSEIRKFYFTLRPGQSSIESFPVRNLSALWYFPVPQTRWNTLVSAILTLNPLRKWKLTLMKRWRISMRDFRFLRTRKSSLEVAFKNRRCQRRRKWKWKVWPQQMQNKVCVAELGAPCWFDIEGNVDHLPLLLVHQLFVFWTRFLPVAAFHVLLRHVSAHDL